MILVLSDFDSTGSGYMQIATSVCSELARRGHRVFAIGWGYDGSEHNWPFSLLPVPHQEAMAVTPAILHNLSALAAAGQLPPIDALVVALDIPLQERALTLQRNYPYIGIFPIESGPLCRSWADVLRRMDAALLISRWGHEQALAAGVSCTYLPVSLDTAAWRLPLADERQALRRALGWSSPDDFVVLTVADNQERKNLWATAEAISIASQRIRGLRWVLVTRIQSPVGFKMDDMLVDLGIRERTELVERGIPFARLWSLYAASDLFMLTSKAEGLCMPVVEAMAAGVPVAATDCTALSEHLWEDWPARRVRRGFPISAAFTMRDPWGNSIRHIADARSAARCIEEVYNLSRRHPGRLAELTARARAYAETRTQAEMGSVLDQVISRASAAHIPASGPPPAPAAPTVLSPEQITRMLQEGKQP